MSISLRLASADDQVAILTILNQGVHNKLRRGDMAWGMAELGLETVDPFIKSKEAYVAELNGQVVGTIFIGWQDNVNWGPQPPEAGYIMRFSINSERRGENIGGQMLDQACDLVKNNGRSYLRLTCPSENNGLKAYYEKQGFVRADAKARPSMPNASHVFYERRVSEDPSLSQTQSTQPKTGFFGKLFHR